MLIIGWAFCISSEARETLYVSLPDDDSLAVIDAESEEILEVVLLRDGDFIGRHAECVQISPDGASVYVANGFSRDISIVATEDNQLVETFDIGHTARGLDVTEDLLYVTTNSGLRVFSRADHRLISVLEDVFLGVRVVSSRDRSRVFVNGWERVFVVDAAQLTIETEIPIPIGQGTLALSEDGSRLYATNLSGAGTVDVIEIQTMKVLTSIPVGSLPFGVDTRGSTGFVSNGSSDTVSVVDLALNSVVNTIEGFEYPLGVAVGQDGSKVYVANLHGSHISVVDRETEVIEGDILLPSGPFEIAILHGVSGEPSVFLDGFETGSTQKWDATFP